MDSKLRELIDLMSDQVKLSDMIASEQLAKISAKIAKLRIEKEMSQKQFADFMGVTQSMVSKWESENYNFSVESLAKICEKLNLNLEINLKEQKAEKKYDSSSVPKWVINGGKRTIGNRGAA